MIPRYTRAEMGRIWTGERRYRIWIDVELLACEAMVGLGQAPVRFERGERIAQLVIAPVTHARLVEADALGETGRGAGGFGSTGQ